MSIKNYISQIPGWHTSRKLVVIHSDDWGSIRMPTKEIFNHLNVSNYVDVNNPYCKLDTLASTNDLTSLFEILSDVKDVNGNNAKITANCIMANPNFEAIKNNNFQHYKYRNLKETFDYYQQSDTLHIWHEGIDKNIFTPQFHGREHLNVSAWLGALRNKHLGALEAFNQGVYGVNLRGLKLSKSNFQAAWEYQNETEKKFVFNSISEGMHLFNEEFNFNSTTAIAPSYTWHPEIEILLENLGIQQTQGIAIQKIPNKKPNKYNRKFGYTTTKRKTLGYQMRNVFFEPALYPNSNLVHNVMHRIDIAFKMQKPAIIGTHRLNFVGVHDIKNRDNTLKLLQTLLRKIVQRWPDVEFMSADQLCNTMQS